MWRQILDWARYFLRHKEQTDHNSAAIEQQQQAINDLAATVQRLNAKLDHQLELGAREREILALRLENILLRSNVGSPGADLTATDDREELARSIVELRRQIVDLQKQIESKRAE